MRYHLLCAVFLLCAPALRAEPPQTASPSQSEVTADQRLRVWLAYDDTAHAKISRAQNAKPALADEDLKDAIADQPKAPRQMGCKDFQSCPNPPLALDIPAGESVETAIRAMVRPWIWLTDARGTRLGVAPTGAGSQAVLALNMQGLGLSGVELNIEPRPEGGVHLWFSRGLELAAIYTHEREALAPRP